MLTNPYKAASYARYLALQHQGNFAAACRVSAAVFAYIEDLQPATQEPGAPAPFGTYELSEAFLAHVFALAALRRLEAGRPFRGVEDLDYYKLPLLGALLSRLAETGQGLDALADALTQPHGAARDWLPHLPQLSPEARQLFAEDPASTLAPTLWAEMLREAGEDRDAVQWALNETAKEPLPSAPVEDEA